MMTYNQYKQIAGYILIQRIVVFIALYQYLNRLYAIYHTDHLGSSSVITDSTGNKVQETYYYPFGQTRINTGNAVKHKYTGQEEDPETGLYFYNARYYDPQLGRFISADSIVGNPRDPQDLNRYTYAGNNPLIYTDPTGHLKLKSIFRGISRILNEAVKYIRKHDEAFAIGGIIAAPFTGGWSMLPYAYGQSPKTTTTFLAAAGAYYGAGELIEAYKLQGDILAKAAIHTVAGATAGGVSSAINGTDVGLGMLTGGISGGFASIAGSTLFGQGKLFPNEFGYQLLGRAAVGGITGGITAEIYGGDFGKGFVQGGITGAAEFLFNCALHECIDKETAQRLRESRGKIWKALKITGVVVEESFRIVIKDVIKTLLLNKTEGAEILDWYMKGIDIYDNVGGGLQEVGERVGRKARKIMEE